MSGKDPARPGEHTETLERSPESQPVARLPARITLERGSAIDRFIVLDLLGEGGMGLVVSAYDGLLDRKVAIKVLRPDRDLALAEASARLLREAQAMARLSHPNVITVYEVGRAGDQVFVAMELVEGETLADWLRQARRPWREIVRKFVPAGRGLAAAHGAGLVHRDFKPDNVLLGEKGVVRVTDFGLAGVATAAPDPAYTLGPRLTHTGTVMGTPAYMAPEQHRGLPVDARTDQFSFCVALYEALYGVRPFAVTSPEEMHAAIAERRMAPGEGDVPRWLRAVVLRGMEPRPEDRWPTMDALLVALDRDPVARRRRWLLLGAAGVAVGALAFALIARETRDVCAADDRLAGVWDPAVRARARAAFLATGRGNAEDSFARTAGLLDEHARAWTAMRRSACEATEVREEQSPHLLDLRMYCLEERRAELAALTGLMARGPDADLVNRAVKAALALRPIADCADAASLIAGVAPPADPGLRARVDRLRARVLHARAMNDAGHYRPALPLAAAAVEDARAVGWTPLVAHALEVRGWTERMTGDFTRAEATLHEAVQVSALARDDQRLATIWSNLIFLVGNDLRRMDDALALGPVARAAVTRAGDEPGQRGNLLRQLGVVHYARGNFPEAVSHYQDALALLEKTGPPTDAAMTHNNLAAVLHDLYRLDEEQLHLERALALFERVLGPEHPDVSMVLSNLGRMENALGRPERALIALERSVAIGERVFGRDHPAMRLRYRNLARAQTLLGDEDAARATYRRVLAIAEKQGKESAAMREAWYSYGASLAELGHLAEAREYLERARTLQEKELGVDHVYRGSTLLELGDVLVAEGRAAEGQRLIEQALSLWDSQLAPDHVDRARARGALGRALLAQGKRAAAIEALEAALARLERRTIDPRMIAEVQFPLAQALVSRDRERALRLARAAASTYEKLGRRGQRRHAAVSAWLAAQ